MMYRLDTWRTNWFEVRFISVDSFESVPETIPENVNGDGFVISFGYTTDHRFGAYRRISCISADDAIGMTRGFEIFLKDNEVVHLNALRFDIVEKKHTIALFEALLEAVKSQSKNGVGET